MNDSRCVKLLQPVSQFLAPRDRDRTTQSRNREIGVPILINHFPQSRKRGPDPTHSERLGRDHGPIAVRMAQRPYELSSKERPGGPSTGRPQRTQGPLERGFIP